MTSALAKLHDGSDSDAAVSWPAFLSVTDRQDEQGNQYEDGNGDFHGALHCFLEGSEHAATQSVNWQFWSTAIIVLGFLFSMALSSTTTCTPSDGGPSFGSVMKLWGC